MGSKVALIILGVLLFIGGIYCVAAPGLTFSVLAPLCGAAMVVDGIGGIFSWAKARKAGDSDGWSLAGAIIGIILGLVLLTNVYTALILDSIFVYIVVLWLIVIGITRIVVAFRMRSARKDAELIKSKKHAGGQIMVGKNWGWVLAMGILMVIVGIFGIVNPLTIALAMGYMIGLSIMVSGLSVITLGLAR